MSDYEAFEATAVPARRERVVAEKPGPTPVTFVVHSTAGWSNSSLFLSTMDGNLARWNITRVIVEEGSAVHRMAYYWCKLHDVHLTVVVIDPTVAQIHDRQRRYQMMARERPDVCLMFNQAQHWLDLAQTLHTAAVKVMLAYPNENNAPTYLAWHPGITRMPPTPSITRVARSVRKGRPRRLLTEAEKKARKAETTAHFDLKRRLRKELAKPPMAFGGIHRRRREKSTALTRLP